MQQRHCADLVCLLHIAGSISTTDSVPFDLISLQFLAAKPRVVSVSPGDEGDFPGHFHVVDPLTVLKVLSLSFSAGLLIVALTLHSVNNPLLCEDPG